MSCMMMMMIMCMMHDDSDDIHYDEDVDEKT